MFTVCRLIEDRYRKQCYPLGGAIESPLLPELRLRLDDVM
jgi:hypothetical protein